MGRPLALDVAHFGSQEIFHFPQKRLALVLGDPVHRGTLEGLQPSADAGRQRRGPWNSASISRASSLLARAAATIRGFSRSNTAVPSAGTYAAF